jgi:hypothetical protein
MPLRISMTLFLFPFVGLGLPPQNETKEPKEPPAVVELIEDDTDGFIKQLNNDGAGLDGTQIGQEMRDVYSGVSSIRVTPFQRYTARIQGWNYPIVEKPQEGQYRYIRFAWKRIDGPGMMIQLHSNGSWNQRYLAGKRSALTAAWGPVLQIADNIPSAWTVVTRDLYKDFGPLTIHGFALTPMDGGAVGLFDHVYLGRSIEDLDRASAVAFGKTPLKEPLTLIQLGKLWADLGKADMKAAGSALRKLVAGRKESVPYLHRMLSMKPLESDVKQIARWIQDLDDYEFQIRETAYRGLDNLGDAAIRHLQLGRAQAGSPEHRNRIEALLKNRGVAEGELTNEQLRLVRAVRVLEWAGTAEALQALDALTKDPPDTSFLPEIRQARERLGQGLKR